MFGYSALSEDEDGKKESAEDHEKRANNAVHAAAASEEGPQLLPSPSSSREVVARDTPLEALVQQLETALLQVSAQGPSELSAPIDRDAALLSLGLDSMTVVQFKGVLENRQQYAGIIYSVLLLIQRPIFIIVINMITVILK